jgi:hypothetical protein
MHSAKKALISAKNKIADNKTKIMGTALVITTGAAVIMKLALKQHDDFLKEKGLYDEYYLIGIFEEK